MPELTRRRFLQASLTAGGALLIGVDLAGCSDDGPAATGSGSSGAESASGAGAATGDGSFRPNLFIRIDPDSSVTLTVHRTEMGQGVRTALAMVLAEELDADWSKVSVVQSDADTEIGEQLTSGSGSIDGAYTALRQAGAAARQLLLAAAAATWGVGVGDVRAERGVVRQMSGTDSLSYGALARTASALDPPASPTLKDPATFTIIGTSVPRVDQLAMATGALQYGTDVRVPGMLFAAVARCPVSGGRVATFDPAPAQNVAGVRSVVAVTSGVAVVADTTWAAVRGRDALTVTWDEGARATLSTASIDAVVAGALKRLVDAEPPLTGSGIEAVYETPYLAHAPMEPLSCVADVRADRCEVWAPTQNPQDVQSHVKAAVGVPVTVHVTMVGGGFGRRLEVDFAVEAAEISKAVGAPVQVAWTREDDIRHDFYRPPTRHWLRAGWDASGSVTSWRHHVAGPGLNGVIYQVGRELLESGLEVPYAIADSVSKAALADVPIPTGPWRAVLDGPNAFANECMLDEVAAALHRDPLELRLALLGPTDLVRPVLTLVADKAAWGSPVPEGRGRGIAAHRRGQTPVAMVAEASLEGGNVRVHKVVCAVDCGLVVNPDMVVQQMEGGIAYGLTAFLHGEITFDAGRVQQGNFNDYPLLQLHEMPDVEVHILPSTRAPKGVGEMAVPPIAPAVANALYAVTGRRIRRTPVRSGDV